MQIITVDDERFEQVLNAWKASFLIGTYSRDGKSQKVTVTNQFVMISPDDISSKIAIKPVKSIKEAETIAKRILKREEDRGSTVELVTGNS